MEDNKEAPFFPTEVLKQLKEKKPITTFIPDDGRDPNPMWDEVARSLWPSTKENQTNRESLAETLMWAVCDDTILASSPEAGIVMARLVQQLMGNTWMKRWEWDNFHPLQRKTQFNKHHFGGAKKVFRNMFR